MGNNKPVSGKGTPKKNGGNETVTHERELERYKAFVENSCDTVLILDENGTVEYQSPCEQFSVPNLVGMIPTDYFHSDDVEAAKEVFRSVLRKPDEIQTVETRIRGTDGDWRWYESRLRNLLGNPDVKGVLVSARDVTRKRRVESELRRNEDALRRMQEVISAAETSLDTKIYRLLELGSDRLRVPYGFVTEIDLAEGEQVVTHSRGEHSLLQEGQSCSLSKAYCRKTVKSDGLVTVGDAVAEGWEDDRAYEEFGYGCYIGAKINDDTGLHGTFCFAGKDDRAEGFTSFERTFVELMADGLSHEFEREARVERLREQKDSIDEFTGFVSHDLRGSLGVLSGYLEQAERTGNPEAFRTCYDTIERMERFIEDLLILAGKTDNEPEVSPVHLGGIARRTWDETDTEDATLSVGDGGTVLADAGHLSHLLRNLFKNSAVHGGADVKVTVGVTDDGFYIEDDGVGIPSEKHEKVLRKGYSTADSGTGLGLRIVRRVAESHGWDVALHGSEEGGLRVEVSRVSFDDG